MSIEIFSFCYDLLLPIPEQILVKTSFMEKVMTLDSTLRPSMKESLDRKYNFFFE